MVRLFRWLRERQPGRDVKCGRCSVPWQAHKREHHAFVLPKEEPPRRS
jgi:hypothetical protein